jgi:uncharacterized protein YggL (DUF469 family)
MQGREGCVSAPCPILGFAVELQVRCDLDDASADRLHAEFSAELLEARGLSEGPRSYRGKTWSFVVHSEAWQTTEVDREALLAWAHGRVEVATVWVGPIVDIQAP